MAVARLTFSVRSKFTAGVYLPTKLFNAKKNNKKSFVVNKTITFLCEMCYDVEESGGVGREKKMLGK